MVTRKVSAQAVLGGSRFRVMLQYADGKKALHQMLPTLCAARHVATKVEQTHLRRIVEDYLNTAKTWNRLEYPRRVYTEVWIGTAIDGRWVEISPRNGGLTFELPARFESTEKSRLSTGQVVDCVLLAEKTRRGGWRAKMVGRRNAGPVTGTPAIAVKLTPGCKVRLKICGVSSRTGSTQFAWPQ